MDWSGTLRFLQAQQEIPATDPGFLLDTLQVEVMLLW